MRSELSQPPTLRMRKKPSIRKTKSAVGQRIFSAEDSAGDVQADAHAALSRTLSELRRSKSRNFARVRHDVASLSQGEDGQSDGGGGGGVAVDGDLLPDDIVEEDENADALAGADDGVADDASTASDESCTLKERQDAINKSHPFGIRIWKPALYKKDRSVQKAADGEIHSTPGRQTYASASPGNLLWTLLFGWWLGALAAAIALICYCMVASRASRHYARVYIGLARYLFYPFGQFVELETDANYLDEDRHIGRNVNHLQDLERQLAERRRETSRETEPLLSGFVGERTRTSAINPKRRAFGRGKWSAARILFYLLFYGLLAPALLTVSMICWLLVFPVPMAKICFLLVHHLRSHPLALSFHWNLETSLAAGDRQRRVLICTYRAMGLRYYKYTIDGTNIFFINLLAVVLFVIADEYVLRPWFGHGYWLTSSALVFVLSLLSIIPLAYFIGQAVASISAQSSIGMGAAINAFFGSVVEIFLYCVALNQGKALLVEGSVVGSILAGILLMPGMSMISGAAIRKTLRFNAKAAGITSTMMLFAVIAAFGPTLFYQIYGSYELKCHGCRAQGSCRRCYFDQNSAIRDPFYQHSVKPFTYACAVLLALSYLVGLWFTLRTHAAMIWQTPLHEEKADLVAQAHASHSIVGTAGLTDRRTSLRSDGAEARNVDRPGSGPDERHADPSSTLRDASGAGARRADQSRGTAKRVGVPHHDQPHEHAQHNEEPALSHGGHDAPNWSRTKSVVILLVATVLYAIIAEILVDTVDVVLENVSIEEKFLGFTLFALVPNTTEFMNAISFALNGNIELSMEIGSAYALQVLLLQIPALVAFSAYSNWGTIDDPAFTFSLIFPRWDLVTVVLCVFLLAHVYAEGKSNYFKGSILCMSYVVVLLGFYWIPAKEEHNLFVQLVEDIAATDT